MSARPRRIKPAADVLAHQPVLPDPFPIVGIGASAGGLAAFSAFFEALPDATAARHAFVLVQHLSPDHESLLATLIGRSTSMPVAEAVDGVRLEPGHVWIIPPGRDVTVREGRLRLTDPAATPGQHLPIDVLLRSLAADVGQRAVAVILSGSASDGAKGVVAVREAGGRVLAQDPASAEHGEMPSAAIATGVVDAVLTPAEIAVALGPGGGVVDLQAPDAADRSSGHVPPAEEPGSTRRILELLRAHTGHDFTGYKPPTIGRRIDRRMVARGVRTQEAYLALLEQSPDEVRALFDDLFIGVTSFFRDPPAFAALAERAIPALMVTRPAGAPVRAWVVGCSTGEEAYSVAILLREGLEGTDETAGLVVFATDIDGRAIAVARQGVYPAAALAGVSPERLARWFVPSDDGATYRVHKVIRDSVVFSEQDVVRDPPFSRLDLITCRNLMIYLDEGVQRRLMPLFHYALVPGGHLLLGASETTGDHGDLFAVVDRAARLYRTRDVVVRSWDLPAGATLGRTHAVTAAGGIPGVEGRGPSPLRQLTETALLAHVGAVAALVAGDGEILYLHGRTGRYLEPQPGEVARSNVLRMARDGLRGALATALREAVTRGTIARRERLSVRSDGDVSLVDLTVRPVTPSVARAEGSRLYLVVLEGSSPVASGDAPAAAAPRAPEGIDPAMAVSAGSEAESEALAALRQELLVKEEILETALSGLATSNEELTASNEELQSVNEELQSTNEELETSKEELQSTNEELATVNAELEARVTDLSRVNDDLSNLVAGTGIATIFVDRQLRIMRFTPTAPAITNLIPGDIGRPLGQVASNLVGYGGLAQDAQTVMDTLMPRTLDVQAADGRWFTVRMQAYRTVADVIAGVVITFVEVTEKKRAEDVLRASEVRFRATVDALVDPVVVLEPARDASGTIVDFTYQYANPAACTFNRITLDQTVGRRLLALFPQQGVAGLLAAFIRVIETGKPFTRDAFVYRDRWAGVPMERIADIRASRLADVLILSWRDVSGLKEAQARILALNDALEQRVAERTAELATANHELETFTNSISHDLRRPLRAISSFTTLLERHIGDATDPKGHHYLDVIAGSADQMEHLLDSLLDFSRLGRQVVQVRPLDWDAIGSTLRTLVEQDALTSGATLEIAEPLAMAEGDLQLVERILVNLVGNALVYHAPDVPPRIHLGATHGPDGVTVAVRDEGIGIAAEQREHIFEPFVRLHRDEEFAGTGIGLAIVRRAARLMGTDVQVVSGGGGSTFSFLLPAADPTPEAPAGISA